MTTGYCIYNSTNGYYLTLRVVDWIDIFTRKIYRDIIIDCFKYCRNYKGLKIWGYVIMSNHVHCILSAQKDRLYDILRDFKRHTSSSVLTSIQSSQERRRDCMMKRFEFAAGRNVRNSLHQFKFFAIKFAVTRTSINRRSTISTLSLGFFLLSRITNRTRTFPAILMAPAACFPTSVVFDCFLCSGFCFHHE